MSPVEGLFLFPDFCKNFFTDAVIQGDIAYFDAEALKQNNFKIC